MTEPAITCPNCKTAVKLAEAQKTQAELLKKQRELDGAKRELVLTVEKRVRAKLDATHSHAKKEAEDETLLELELALARQSTEYTRIDHSSTADDHIQNWVIKHRWNLSGNFIEKLPKNLYGFT